MATAFPQATFGRAASEVRSGLQRWSWPYVILAAAFLGWAVFRLAYPGVLAGTDVYHFKDAGCNLAMGHGFTSNNHVGTQSLEPSLWFGHGPVMPVLFGLAARMFGCSAQTNLIFELALGAVLATVALATLLRGTRNTFAALAIAAFLALLLPTGGYQWPHDRPDPLALAFILAAVAIARGAAPEAGVPAHAFTFAGLALVTSPYYGCVAWLLCAVSSIRRPGAASVRRWALSTFAFLAPALLIVCAYAALDARSLMRFLVHVGIIFGNPMSFPELLIAGISGAGLQSMFGFLAFLAAIPCCLFAIGWAANRGLTQVRVEAAALLVVASATFILFARQSNYFSAVAFLTFVLLFSARDEWPGKPARSAMLLLALLHAASLGPGAITQVIHPVRMRESFLAQHANAEREAKVLLAAKGEQVALVPPSHYFMYKPLMDRLLNPDYLSPAHDRNRMGMELSCRAGSTLALPSQQYLDGRLFERPRDEPVRGGVPGLVGMRSYWDWGCASYVRGTLRDSAH